MGMTKVFYFVKKNQLTPEIIHEKLKGESILGYQSHTVFYQKNGDLIYRFVKTIMMRLCL